MRKARRKSARRFRPERVTHDASRTSGEMARAEHLDPFGDAADVLVEGSRLTAVG
ncbi:MAG: hypothetical protein ACJ74J_18585 [Blastocatellia bacterium]